MALQINKDVEAAWRALLSSPPSLGWALIDISTRNFCTLKAGRSCENNETILVGVKLASIENISDLPSGNGFKVSTEKIDDKSDYIYFAITKENDGDLELFSKMIEDILETVVDISVKNVSQLVINLINRVNLWQDFMKKKKRPLSKEEELGLFGEITFLQKLFKLGLPSRLTVKYWVGVKRGLHDFIFAEGAIEVKSTIASNGFRAKIFSLDQLDSQELRYLYLCGLKFTIEPKGKNLPDLIMDIQKYLKTDVNSLMVFNSCILLAGFNIEDRKLYHRTFNLVQSLYWDVNDKFPKLTRTTVPDNIVAARYDIELGNINTCDLTLESILKKLLGK